MCAPACGPSGLRRALGQSVGDKEGVGVYGCRRRGLHARMKKVGVPTGDGMV